MSDGSLGRVGAIVFDVFGTVVDWWGTIVAEGTELRVTVDWGAFARDWLVGYRTRVEAVRTGQRAWAVLDTLLDEAFQDLVIKYQLVDIDGPRLDRFRRVWHRLTPWRDVISGLRRLRGRYVVATLSNANLALLVDMARDVGLAWDCVLCAELVKKYKPEPETYRLALSALGTDQREVLYVAAHKWDLEAGQSQGLKAAYLPRPLQLGPGGPPPEEPNPAFDIVVQGVDELADALGA
jgi:2-haloacid dehalogenase